MILSSLINETLAPGFTGSVAFSPGGGPCTNPCGGGGPGNPLGPGGGGPLRSPGTMWGGPGNRGGIPSRSCGGSLSVVTNGIGGIHGSSSSPYWEYNTRNLELTQYCAITANV